MNQHISSSIISFRKLFSIHIGYIFFAKNKITIFYIVASLFDKMCKSIYACSKFIVEEKKIYHTMSTLNYNNETEIL